MTLVKATLKGQFMVTALRESQLPRFKNLPVNEPSKKPPCRVVFSFLREKITLNHLF